MAKTKNSNPPAHPILKKILIAFLILIALPPLALITFLFIRHQTGDANTFGTISFEQTLPIPPLAESTVAQDGTRIFNLTAQKGTTTFLPGAATETWGINDNYLGPTLRAKRSENVKINLTNNLTETTTMHWHGMHLPAEMDGGPHQPIKPGTTWSPTWTIKQPAATLWYHPHPHGETAKHVYRGLAGMFILDETEPTTLPHDYGKDDIPVIIQDKKFKDSNQLDTSNDGSIGIIGNEILVNGVRTPHLDITHEKVRLRLLNASNARIYNFGLSNGDSLVQIASDGGLLEAPIPQKQITLSPGERAEVVVSLKPNERASLRSYPQPLNSGFLNDRTIGADDSFEILQLRASGSLAASPALPVQLTTIPRLPKATAVRTRSFELKGIKINDKTMDMQRIDVNPTLGDTEIWEIANKGGDPHNFHIHDVQFQVLSFNGAPPPPQLGGWKDTILLKPDQKAQLIMQFTDYSNARIPYMFHCHLLRHEDQGMMGQFVVTAPGQIPALAIPHDATSDHAH